MDDIIYVQISFICRYETNYRHFSVITLATPRFTFSPNETKRFEYEQKKNLHEKVTIFWLW